MCIRKSLPAEPFRPMISLAPRHLKKVVISAELSTWYEYVKPSPFKNI